MGGWKIWEIKQQQKSPEKGIKKKFQSVLGGGSKCFMDIFDIKAFKTYKIELTNNSQTSKNPCYAQATWDQICLKKKTKQNKTKQKKKQDKNKTKKIN